MPLRSRTAALPRSATAFVVRSCSPNASDVHGRPTADRRSAHDLVPDWPEWGFPRAGRNVQSSLSLPESFMPDWKKAARRNLEMANQCDRRVPVGAPAKILEEVCCRNRRASEPWRTPQASLAGLHVETVASWAIFMFQAWREGAQ